jgi:SAM-dependent methyltransferase
MDESKIETEKVSCRLCGSDKERLLFKTDNARRGTKKLFNVVECLDCGFRFTNPPPTEYSMKEYYPESYEALVPEKISLLEEVYYRTFRRIPGAKGRILDIGCGNGKFLYLLKKMGWEAYGQDLSNVPDFVKKDFKIFEGELFDSKIEDGFFDAVTLWGSIEHMRSPLKVLEECHRILKKGGSIVVWTTNNDSLEARIFRRYWHHLLVPEHYSQFTDKTLVAMVKKAGFGVERIRYDSISFGFINSIQLYLNNKNINIRVSNWLTKLLFIPVDVISSLLKRSAMITLYGKKE